MTAKDLPDSDLICLLEERATQRTDISFDFIVRLKEFRARVSDEVRFINVLFPEYTPHDNDYHLKRLFSVADKVLGRERMERFHDAELFVLAAALYGHDWGMAVSELEKEYILTGKAPAGTPEESIWVLPDEKARLRKFAKEQSLHLDETDRCPDMPIELWREYVRQTHAFRSGERVRRYFQKFDGGVAEAVDRVCVGHWLNFEKLHDHNSYPTNFAVLRDPVNLRALTVYVRLIDLLDLAEDRTPYVIWKFVAPRNPTSKMEWEKHRALRPATPVPYQDGRILQIDGSTDDHEVYAALEDLKAWVNGQFRGCNDLLARLSDPRHKLDLYHIDWRIAARGFEPVSIQFEFDRNRMFDILSEEIYRGDSYVFLRELLQNSIDAIRTRREMLRLKDLSMSEPSIIRVEVGRCNDGDVCVTFQDSGVGMDEYIVRNYLAVAGRSYYSSQDFEREGLHMDPIARFGVGLLSCFMVANRVEIDTYRDKPAKPLRIKIPAVDKRFRIEALEEDELPAGTTVRVYIDNRKLTRKNETNTQPLPLRVTEYLKIIAGFVEFPIAIKENEQRTLIVHPHQDPSPAIRKVGEDFMVHQLDISYPWEAAFHHKEIALAREHMQEMSWDLTSDLNLVGYEGAVSFCTPIHSRIQIDHDWLTLEAVSGKSVTIGMPGPELVEEISESSRISSHFAIYKDGILLGKASPQEILGIRGDRGGLSPSLRVNLKSSDLQVDLSRTRLLPTGDKWEAHVRKNLAASIFESWKERLATSSLPERIEHLGFLNLSFGISSSEIAENLNPDSIPVPFIEEGGRLTYVSLEEIQTSIISLLPDVEPYRTLPLETQLHSAKQWRGTTSMAAWYAYPRTSLSAGFGLATSLIFRSHKLSRIQIVSSPWQKFPLMAQEILAPESNKEIKGETLLEKAAKDPLLLSLGERRTLSELINDEAEFCEFSEPFDFAFSYGSSFINIRHPAAHSLIRFQAAFQLAKQRNDLPRQAIEDIQDAVVRLHSSSLRFLPGRIRGLFKAGREVGFWREKEATVDPDELIAEPREGTSSLFVQNRPFGEPVRSRPQKAKPPTRKPKNS